MIASRARLSLLLVLGVTVATSARAPVAAACPAFNIVARPMGGQTEIAVGGGLLVVQSRDHGGMDGPGRFSLELGGKPPTYTSDWLAPGLERWQLAAAAGATVTLTQGAGAPTDHTLVAGAKLRAPAIRAAHSTMVKPRGPMNPMGGPVTTLTIVLAKPLPPGVVGLIVYGPRRGDPGIAWTPVEAGETTFTIHGGGKSCGGGPGPIFARDRLAFAYVDARGLVSSRSPLRAVPLTPPDAPAAD